MASTLPRSLCRAQLPRTVARFYSGNKPNQRFADSFGTLGGQAPSTERLDRHQSSFFQGQQFRQSDEPPLTFRRGDQRKKKTVEDRWSAEDSGGPPTITEPVLWKREREKRVKKTENKPGRAATVKKNAKVLIECARPEFNHLEGTVYSRRDQIPLASQYWAKNKYKDDWFVIRPTQKMAPAFAGNPTQWEELSDYVEPQVAANLVNMGIKKPTVFQGNSIRSFRSSDHLFIASETGSGKTVVFAAPLISHISKKQGRKALVLVPSAVLRRQAYNMISEMARGVDTVAVVSDENFSPEGEWNILVATPGKAIKCLGEAKCTDLDTIVMDEADMLMDDSFVSVLTELLAIVPVKYSETNAKNPGQGARVIFSSATCEDELQELAEGIVDAQKLIFLRSSGLHGILPHVEQKFIRVREMDKLNLLTNLVSEDLLKASESSQTLVFCKDSSTVHYVSKSLAQSGFSNTVISGRSSELAGNERIFVGTDVASRGLDLPKLQHVINYDFPRHMVDVLHRFGRVGRCSSAPRSHVTSFVRNPWEVEIVNALELAARLDRPIPGIEVNVAGRIQRRREDSQEAAV